MTGDNCSTCKHIYYSMADQGYGEYAPGKDVTIMCIKGVWELDTYEDTQEDFISHILSARECDMYEDG